MNGDEITDEVPMLFSKREAVAVMNYPDGSTVAVATKTFTEKGKENVDVD